MFLIDSRIYIEKVEKDDTVKRHRRRIAAYLVSALTCCAVLAGAGAGLGIGLSSSSLYLNLIKLKFINFRI